MQGRFIVFEGVEGSGKTTQLRRSQAWLLESLWLKQLQAQGYISQLIVTRQPGGTQLGQSIRQLLLHPTQASIQTIQNRAELLLYAADRAQHVEELLRPQLEQGALILCDRYTDSTIAYQGYGRGLDLKLIHQLNQAATDSLESDLTLWFDLDAEQGLARTRLRGTTDRIEQDGLAFHRRVQQGFTELAFTNPDRIVRIDASRSEAEVSDQVQAILQKWLIQWYPALLPPS